MANPLAYDLLLTTKKAVEAGLKNV